MTHNTPIENKALAHNARASKHKETYKLLEKNSAYRIGVGARVPSTEDLSFFVEVVISLSSKPDKVDLARLERTLKCLRSLQEHGYTLTFEDSTRISCEKKPIQDLNKEYVEVNLLLEPLK